MKNRLVCLSLVLLPLVLGSRPAAAQAVQKVRYQPHRISADEVTARAPDAKTAYDIVKRLRPQFFRQRPSGSMRDTAPVPVRVYVDGVYMGDTPALTQVMASSVVEISYLGGADATTRFGTGHENGAILVITGRH